MGARVDNFSLVKVPYLDLEPMEKVDAKRGLEFTRDSGVEITIATNAGACFGVVRAIKLGYQAIAKAQTSRRPIYSFGPLIHNPHVVKEMKEKGVVTVSGPNEVDEGTVVLRSHGVQKEAESNLRQRGIQIVDATCPLVKKPQRIAKSLGEKSIFLILVGDANHPEVQGVVSYYASPNYLVTYCADDLGKIPSEVRRVGILAQTTIEAKVFEAVVQKAKERFEEVQTFNTICDATSIRQTEAVTLAQTADVLVVVGGRNSSNTNKLVKICKSFQENTYHIEDSQEIDPAWFQGKRKIGITGGASTPHEFVDAVGNYIANLIQPSEA